MQNANKNIAFFVEFKKYWRKLLTTDDFCTKILSYVGSVCYHIKYF